MQAIKISVPFADSSFDALESSLLELGKYALCKPILVLYAEAFSPHKWNL